MRCPVDQNELKMSERQGVEIDYCPQCRGVWLDRGELDKIMERAAQPEPRPAYEGPAHAKGFDRDDDNDYRRGYGAPPPYDQRRRKRSFLDDIFDFD
jgi:Zn-finger nucleic acid-binding protein